MNLEKLTGEELKKHLTMGRTSGKRMAFEFWLKNLQATVPHTGKFNSNQIHYVARLLTVSSLVSADPSTFYFPSFTSLLQIYEEFSTNYYYEKLEQQVMELAGCQALVLGGFYREAAKKSDLIKPLERLGKVFLTGAAVGKREQVIKELINHYGEWEDQLSYLEWYLRNERLVLDVAKPDDPLIKI